MESATKIYFADICPKCSNKESDSQQAVVTCVMFVFLIAHQLTLQWDLPSAKPGFRSVYPRRDSVSWDGRAAQCPRNTRLPPPRCRLSLLTVSIRSLGDEEMPQLKSECQTEEHWGKHKVKKIRQKNGEHVGFLQVETEFGTFSFYPTVRSGSFFDAKTILIPLIFPGEQSRCFLPAELEQLSENSSFYGSVFSQTSMKLRKESRDFVSEEMSTVKSLALKIETYKNVGLRRSSCPSDCQQGGFYNSSIK